ncbi:MAG: cadherin-like beta sandwich domain-containing protein [Clostridium sp.]|nr:cadherin-like beta sandwich domain-containing protein [Clostridium sp.]
MSDNCFLSSLQITPGELKPEFSKDVYSYETTVPGETTSLAINALPEDSKSSVSIDGNENFEPGKQAHVTIKVTAETGDTHIYDLTVNVEEIVDTRAVINVNGTDYYFSQDYSKISVPEGFAQSKEKFDGTDVILYTSPNGQIKCAYLTDKDGKNGAWYIIDLNAKTAVPLINVQSAYKNFIILEPSDNVSKPEGYSSFSYDFGGNTVTAYHVTENDEVILVYAMSPDSDPSWYRYDTVEKTFVRYNADPVTEKQEEAASDSSFFDQHKDKVLTICIIVVVVMFFLIIILACMLVRVIRKGLPEDDEPDDPNDPDKMTDEDIDTDAIDDAGDNVGSNANEDIHANAIDNAGDSVESDATDDTDDNIEADTTDDADDANVDSETSETSSVTDVADNSEIVDDSAKADTIDDTADSDSSEDSEQLVLNESSDKDSIEASSIPEIKTKTEPAEADTTDLQATTEEAVATDTTEAEQPEPDANASVKGTAAATHDGMTELKAEPATKAENITSTRLSAGAKKEQELTPAEEIVKKAAKYSSMNTADLSEVFNMAEAIINHEDPKKNAGSLQFKPIKQNAPEDKKEK